MLVWDYCCNTSEFAGQSPPTWGEQGVRPPVPRGRARGGTDPAGHAGRAVAGRRDGHTGLLYTGRVGTQVADGGLPWRYDASGGVAVVSPAKETREFDGVTYVLERGIRTDFALVHAWQGDRHGNLMYRHAAANFNPECASAGRITIAEVEHLVEPGEIDPATVHTPGVFVHRVVHVPNPAKKIERETVRQ